MKNALILIAFLLVSLALNGQSFDLIPQNIALTESPALKAKFSQSKQFGLDVNALYKYLSSHPKEARIYLPISERFQNQELVLSANNLLADDFFITRVDESGRLVEEALPYVVHTFSGTLSDEPECRVSITVTPNIFYLNVVDGAKKYFIEPARNFDKSYPENAFVYYEGNDVIFSSTSTCAYEEIKQKTEDVGHEVPEGLSGACRVFICELAIASDYSMHFYYGYAGTIAHNINIMNGVRGYFLGDFNDDIVFKITTQFVATGNSSSNPWVVDPNANNYLSNFRIWAEAGGFGAASYDLGQCWTRIPLYGDNGSVAGIAYKPGICSPYRYHLATTINAELSECEQICVIAHEIGHNFNAGHTPDDNPDIMSPPAHCSISGWHTNSLSEINFYLSLSFATGCMQQCTDSDLNLSSTPGYLAYICSGEGQEYCKTYGPCIRGIDAQTTDPHLVINTYTTEQGTTICLESIRRRQRTSTVTVTPYGYCGLTGPTVNWTIYIDYPGCEGGFGFLGGGIADRNIEGSTFDPFTANIANGRLIISGYDEATVNPEFQIFSLGGKLLGEGNINSSVFEYSVQHLPSQIIFVKIQSPASNKVFKLFVP